MSGLRLGRLLGSFLLVSSLVVAAGAVAELEFRTSGMDWAIPCWARWCPDGRAPRSAI